MRIIDKKFKHDVGRYVLQCSLATLAIMIMLVFLDFSSYTPIIAVLGAGCFIAFRMPGIDASRPRFMIGGYLAGITAGCICHFLSLSPVLMRLFVTQETSSIVLGGL